MGTEVIEINCFNNDRLFAYFLRKQLQIDVAKLDENKHTRLTNNDLIVDFTMKDKKMKLTVTTQTKREIHVCMASEVISASNIFSIGVKRQVDRCKQAYPGTPIIILGYDDGRRYEPDEIKEIYLEGESVINRKIGNKLANEIGAVKYIEFSRLSGRGMKILLDKIAFAGLGKLKEDCYEREAKRDNINVLLDIFLNIIYYF